MNSPHLSDITLVVLAMSRRGHPHLEHCAYCREQYNALVEMEAFEDEEEADLPVAADPDARPYRLAAQSVATPDTGLQLRRTWYLDEGRILLRVFEEDAERLVGYLICPPERLSSLRIRFSELPGPFVPGKDGSFVIGPAALPIEPMNVTLEDAS